MVLFISILSYHFFRYWDESRGEDGKGGEVVDEFLATHEVGHEPADIQVKHIMETLEKSNIAGCCCQDGLLLTGQPHCHAEDCQAVN